MFIPPLFEEEIADLADLCASNFEEKRKIYVSRCSDMYEDDRANSDQCNGPARHKALEDLMQDLETRWPRAPNQIRFHEEYTKAALGKIYGEDLLRNIADLMERYRISEIKSDVIITAPRRYGKTMSVALYVTAFILSQPGRKVVIFSTGRRASQSLLELIKTMVDYLLEDKSRLISSNTERIVVKSIWGQTSEVVSLPNNVKIKAFFFSSLFFLSRASAPFRIADHTFFLPLRIPHPIVISCS